MTENEWLATDNLDRMLVHLRGTASVRKLRLFAAACCRRVEDLLTDPLCREAVQLLEHLAEGPASEQDLRRALALWLDSPNNPVSFATRVTVDDEASWFAAVDTAHAARGIRARAAVPSQGPVWVLLTPILRDLFGNP